MQHQPDRRSAIRTAVVVPDIWWDIDGLLDGGAGVASCTIVAPAGETAVLVSEAEARNAAQAASNLLAGGQLAGAASEMDDADRRRACAELRERLALVGPVTAPQMPRAPLSLCPIAST